MNKNEFVIVIGFVGIVFFAIASVVAKSLGVDIGVAVTMVLRFFGLIVVIVIAATLLSHIEKSSPRDALKFILPLMCGGLMFCFLPAIDHWASLGQPSYYRLPLSLPVWASWYAQTFYVLVAAGLGCLFAKLFEYLLF